jgi:hypothetical protein
MIVPAAHDQASHLGVKRRIIVNRPCLLNSLIAGRHPLYF